MPTSENHAKLQRLIFKLNTRDWHGHANEGIWAEQVQGSDDGMVFRLANSPFFARGVSYRDIVRALSIPGTQELFFDRVLQHSGHSTYMILVPEGNTEFETCWTKLQLLGCTYEGTSINISLGTTKLYSVDIPGLTDIYAVYSILKIGEKSGVWTFQEGHVGHKLK